MTKKKSFSIKVSTWLLSGLMLASSFAAPQMVYAKDKDNKQTEEVKEEKKESKKEKKSEDARAAASLSVVQVLTGYEFDDGSFDVWLAGSGVYIGDQKVLTSFNNVAYNGEDDIRYQEIIKGKSALYNKVGISLDSFDNVTAALKTVVVLQTGDAPKAVLASSAAKSGTIAVLSVDADFTGMQAVAIAETQESEGKAVGAGDAAVRDTIGRLSYNGPILGFTTTTVGVDEIDDGFVGAPVISDTGEIVGLVQSKTGQVSSVIDGETLVQEIRALSGGSGTEVQPEESSTPDESESSEIPEESSVGESEPVESEESSMVPIESEDSSEESVPAEEESSESTQEQTDVRKRLETAVMRAKNIDTDGFTEESVAAFTDAIAQAESLLENPLATEEEMTQAGEAINEAKDGLEEKIPEAGKTNIAGLAILVVVVLLFFALLGYIVKLLIFGKKTKKEDGDISEDREEKEDKKEKKRALKEQKKAEREARRAEEAENKKQKQKKAEEERPADKPKEKTADISNDDDDDEGDGGGDTTLLKKVPPSYLRSLENHNIVRIDKTSFIIGKERKKVNYCISNPTVSRKHCVIRYQDNGFYIEDLESLNKTSINGGEIVPGNLVRLTDGDRITISDQNFIWREGEPEE